MKRNIGAAVLAIECACVVGDVVGEMRIQQVTDFASKGIVEDTQV